MKFQELLEGNDLAQNAAGSVSTREGNREETNMAFVQEDPSDSVETIDLTESPEPEPTYQHSVILPSAIQANNSLAQPKLFKHARQRLQGAAASVPQTAPCKRIQSYKTLRDFYTLLDKIERTSYVGALFLEAYAEKLRDDMCKSCWFRHNVQCDLF